MGEVASDEVVTAGEPQAVRLHADRTRIEAGGGDVAVVTVSVTDAEGNLAPRADNLVSFEVTGPARIIGVGNGDPGSHDHRPTSQPRSDKPPSTSTISSG